MNTIIGMFSYDCVYYEWYCEFVYSSASADIDTQIHIKGLASFSRKIGSLSGRAFGDLAYDRIICSSGRHCGASTVVQSSYTSNLGH